MKAVFMCEYSTRSKLSGSHSLSLSLSTKMNSCTDGLKSCAVFPSPSCKEILINALYGWGWGVWQLGWNCSFTGV
jgi:hypothetical protein